MFPHSLKLAQPQLVAMELEPLQLDIAKFTHVLKLFGHGWGPPAFGASAQQSLCLVRSHSPPPHPLSQCLEDLPVAVRLIVVT